MNIKDKILEISKLLDEVDKFNEDIPNIQQEFDYKISDLYHKLEDMKLDAAKCYRFCKELKNVLLDRRDFKDNVEIMRVYQQNKLKLNSGIEQRKMLLSNMGKREKQLHYPYNPRVYTEEELIEKIGE